VPLKDPDARRAYRRKYYASEQGKAIIAKHNKNYAQQNRKKFVDYQLAFKARDITTYKKKARTYSRNYLYGEITRSEPERCEACSIPFAETKKGSCVDHDHKTGKFRGWLCSACNFALGHLNDSKERIERLGDYLDMAELLS
jgi:hypothetical protein